MPLKIHENAKQSFSKRWKTICIEHPCNGMVSLSIYPFAWNSKAPESVVYHVNQILCSSRGSIKSIASPPAFRARYYLSPSGMLSTIFSSFLSYLELPTSSLSNKVPDIMDRPNFHLKLSRSTQGHWRSTATGLSLSPKEIYSKFFNSYIAGIPPHITSDRSNTVKPFVYGTSLLTTFLSVSIFWT